MKIDFANLSRGYLEHKNEFDEAIANILNNASFIMGKTVSNFEEELSSYVGTKHAISCSSGTDALILAMMSLGIGEGDEVITTPFTFIATAETIAFLKAKPVFVDVNIETFNIDDTKIKEAITPNTKAIIPVSLYGQIANMEAIKTIAKRHNIAVIEDAAQSFGATQNNKKSCNLSDIGCTSFFPAKPLGCFGDGGALFTDDDKLADKIISMRIHGQTKHYYHQYIGIAGRLDALQAAVLSIKLKHYQRNIDGRQSLANFYNEHIKLKNLVKPKVLENNTSVWAQYTLLVEDNRDDFQDFLKEKGIPTAIYYPKSLHLQRCFDYLGGKKGEFEVSERISEKVISIPMNPYFTEQEKTYIVDIINSY